MIRSVGPVLMSALCLVGGAAREMSATGRPEPATAKPANQGDSGFAARSFAALAAGRTGNVLYSPESLGEALSAVYLGARGKTAEQMAAVLGLKENPEDYAKEEPHPPRTKGSDRAWTLEGVVVKSDEAGVKVRRRQTRQPRGSDGPRGGRSDHEGRGPCRPHADRARRGIGANETASPASRSSTAETASRSRARFR